MKTSKMILGIFILLTLATTNNYAQEIMLKTTEKNLTASKSTIDMPGLSGNPQAIIVATPLGDTAKLNQHPIGAWYYDGKWNIFNTDHSTMSAGLNFKVQVFLKPDPNHFLHIVTKENLIGDGSYIDNPALNNNPNAQVIIFQNHAPDNRTAYLNKYEAKAEYDSTAGKWSIKNVNGERLFPGTAYNIVVTPGQASSASNALRPGPAFTPSQFTSQSLPLSVVAKNEVSIPLNGFGPTGSPKCLAYTYSNPDILITDHAIVTGQSIAGHPDIRWQATVSNGAAQIILCYDKSWLGSPELTIPQNPDGTYTGAMPAIKVNILVLR